MSRSDSNLITGLSSASSRRMAIEAQKKAQSKQAKAAYLRPETEVIFDEITKLKLELADEIRGLVHPTMSEVQVQIALLGLQLAERKIVSLESRLKHVLKAEVTRGE